MNGGFLTATALLVLLLFLALFVYYPVGSGIASSFVEGDGFALHRFADMVEEGKTSTATALWNSVSTSVLTVILGGLMGTLLAVATSLTRFRFRRIASAAAVVPIAMPPLVGVIALLFVFGDGGILPRLAANLFGVEEAVFALNGFAGIVAVHVYAFHVYTFLFVTSSLREIDGSLLEAASGLGSGPGRMFFRIILPELMPALLGAASLTFMSSMASFSAPFLLGGGMPFLTTVIYSTKLNGDLDLAGAQSTFLLLISVLFFVLLTLSSRRTRGGTSRKGVAVAWVPGFTPLVERFLIGAAVLVLVFEFLPVLAIIVISFAQEGSWTWQLLPTEYTLENYSKLLTEAGVFEPVGNSLLMGTLSVLVSAFVGTAAAFFLTKGVLRRFRDYLDPLLTLSFAIPGTVVAIYLIVAFGEPRWITGGEVLVGTFWILPLAYFIRTYPLVLRSASSSLDRLENSTVEAAEMFGAGPARVLVKVVLPVILPGILAGSLLVLVSALGEFPSSILLYTHANRPISIEILSQLRGYNFGSAGAYSVGLLALVLLFSIISGRAGSGGKKEGGRFHF